MMTRHRLTLMAALTLTLISPVGAAQKQPVTVVESSEGPAKIDIWQLPNPSIERTLLFTKGKYEQWLYMMEETKWKPKPKPGDLIAIWTDPPWTCWDGFSFGNDIYSTACIDGVPVFDWRMHEIINFRTRTIKTFLYHEDYSVTVNRTRYSNGIVKMRQTKNKES